MKKNHVIFLGAGASYTSGYPIGQNLRLLLASKDHFKAKLDKLYLPVTRQRNAKIDKCLSIFDRFASLVDLFRHGGFATVDEFSKLASKSYPEHVKNMKILMCVALSLHNPELNFEESDYYPFIQRLFRNDALEQIRNDITIITFNYDCYLDYLLREALRYRRAVSEVSQTVKNCPDILHGPQELVEPWSSIVSSGFNDESSEKQQAWSPNHFKYFKLHGSIAYGLSKDFGYERLFIQDAPKRFEFLDNDWFASRYVPPIVFPWELFDPNTNNIIEQDDFILVKNIPGGDQKARHAAIQRYKHFKTMWENARKAVNDARKISFVGLSMHEYLESGMKYLFEDFSTLNNTKEIEAVVANPDNELFVGDEKHFHPNSPRGRVTRLLQIVAPQMKCIPSSSEEIDVFHGNPEEATEPGITIRNSFKEFIEREMG